MRADSKCRKPRRSGSGFWRFPKRPSAFAISREPDFAGAWVARWRWSARVRAPRPIHARARSIETAPPTNPSARARARSPGAPSEAAPEIAVELQRVRRQAFGQFFVLEMQTHDTFAVDVARRIRAIDIGGERRHRGADQAPQLLELMPKIAFDGRRPGRLLRQEGARLRERGRGPFLHERHRPGCDLRSAHTCGGANAGGADAGLDRKSVV